MKERITHFSGKRQDGPSGSGMWGYGLDRAGSG